MVAPALARRVQIHVIIHATRIAIMDVHMDVKAGAMGLVAAAVQKIVRMDALHRVILHVILHVPKHVLEHAIRNVMVNKN